MGIWALHVGPTDGTRASAFGSSPENEFPRGAPPPPGCRRPDNASNELPWHKYPVANTQLGSKPGKDIINR